MHTLFQIYNLYLHTSDELFYIFIKQNLRQLITSIYSYKVLAMNNPMHCVILLNYKFVPFILFRFYMYVEKYFKNFIFMSFSFIILKCLSYSIMLHTYENNHTYSNFIVYIIVYIIYIYIYILYIS